MATLAICRTLAGDDAQDLARGSCRPKYAVDRYWPEWRNLSKPAAPMLRAGLTWAAEASCRTWARSLCRLSWRGARPRQLCMPDLIRRLSSRVCAAAPVRRRLCEKQASSGPEPSPRCCWCLEARVLEPRWALPEQRRARFGGFPRYVSDPLDSCFAVWRRHHL